MRNPTQLAAVTTLAALLVACCPGSLRAEQQPAAAQTADLWQLAKQKQHVHRFSTLITAQQVRDHLSDEKGIAAAVDWCRRTAVIKVYIETFRDGYQARRETLQRAKQRFLADGFDVSGCVTTTQVGKRSTGWRGISCYTDQPTQQRLQEIFEYTAGLFDEIMIDDFWFTDCTCPDCDAARKAKTVTIGQKKYPVTGDTWEDYRCELMVRLARDRVLAAAKRVNPKARLIIKYPQWYDRFHERGYEVVRETDDFDRIWVGTETRNYDDARWGGTPQYEAYFIMRWLGGIGGQKCGGGWFDPYGTTEHTYLEQARQTVLAGARESLLFCYGSLLERTGPKNVETLRANVPELLSVAEEAARRKVVGLAAYKPPGSHPEKEPRVFDFVGMMGLPLVPCHDFPTDAKAAFFSVHALKDPDLPKKLAAWISASGTVISASGTVISASGPVISASGPVISASGTGVPPVLITDGLAKQLKDKVNLDAPNVRILPVGGDPKSLLQLRQQTLDAVRRPLLRPFGRTFRAPNKVALYLFDDGSWVIENFNDQPVTAELDGTSHTVKPRSWIYHWQSANDR